MSDTFGRFERAGRLASWGEGQAALDALYFDEQMAPHLKKAVEEDIAERGLTGFIKDVATNPLTILGLLLTFGTKRWRLSNPASRAALRAQVRSIDKDLGFVARTVGTAYQTLGDDVAGDLYRFAGHLNAQRAYLLSDLLAAQRAYRKAAGPVTTALWQKIVAKLNRLDEPGSEMGRSALARIRGVSPAREAIYQTIRFSPAEQKLYEATEAYFQRGGELVSQINRLDKPEIIVRQLVGQRGEGWLVAPAKGPGFWPRRFSREWGAPPFAAKGQEGADSVEELLALYKQKPVSRVTTAHVQPRTVDIPGKGYRVSWVIDPLDLNQIDDLLTPAGRAAYKRMLDHPAEYMFASGKAVPVIQEHANDLARVAAWAIPPKAGQTPFGRRLMDAYQMFKTKGDLRRQQFLRDLYIPAALDRYRAQDLAGVASYTKTKVKALEWLAQEGKTQRFLPDWFKKQMTDYLAATSSWNQLSAKAAGVMYVGALGGNATSPIWNTLQTVIATGPYIGWDNAWIGLKRTLRGSERYFKMRAKGLKTEMAFAKAFPKFAKTHLPGSPMSSEAVSGHLEEPWALAAGSKWERVKNAMMLAFATSERFVRLVAYEGARAAAVKHGKFGEMAIREGIDALVNTQFAGGMLSAPAIFHRLGAGPLSRQFLQFPAGYLRFILEGLQEARMGDPTRLGRALLGSTLTYEAGKNLLGVNLSHGLLFGALPEAHPNAPFYPWAGVPPAYGLVGAAAEDIMAGEFNKLRYQLPILVPGGVAAARFAGVTPLGEAIGRSYADYRPEARSPDGKIPLFTDRGQLKGYASPAEIVLQGMGFRTTSKEQEQELVAWLAKHRDYVRDLRRTKIEARLDNDHYAADAADAEYRRLFPNAEEIPVKEQDWRAAKLRREVTRLERLLETTSADVRTELGGVLAAALYAGGSEDLMGIDPALLAEPTTPTILSRRPSWQARSRRRPQVANPLQPEPGRGDLQPLAPALKIGELEDQSKPIQEFASFGGW